MLRTLLFLSSWSIAILLMAQPPNDDCASAVNLCADQPQAANNTGAIGPAGFCPGTDNVIWYSFITNSVGGVVNVEVTNINCPMVAGMDNEISVVVLSGDGSCAPSSFAAVSNCVADSVNFTVTSAPLLPNTQYWVLVSGVMNNGATLPAACTMSITTNGPGADIVDVDFDAGNDVEIGEGEIVQLMATGGTTYNWSPTSGLSGNTVPDPFAQPSETTIYSVSTVINGCTYVDQVLVEVVRRIDPPNTFTPNDDGINDTWQIEGIGQFVDAEVIVYDRWGQKVFKSTGYREPWDGTNNGAKLPTGTYYYYIRLNQLEGKSPPYTGSISIIR